jgi:hypothetical protein
VVVIDVASSDGSIEELATAHPTGSPRRTMWVSPRRRARTCCF